MSKKFTAPDKKKITNDWLREFPSLGVYRPMRLLNRIGPLLVGIALEVSSGNYDYLPIFHVHNLTNSLDFVSLGLYKTITQTRITLKMHENKYKELTVAMKEKEVIPFEGNLDLQTILQGFRNYVEADPEQGVAMLPSTLEDMVLISGWCGDKLEIQRTLMVAESKLIKLDDRILIRLGGLDQWISSLEKKALNQEHLHKICEQQIIKLNVEKLPLRTLLC